METGLELLEDAFALLLVNAQHIKAVPGRKTDVKDAEWIADLSQHGSVCAPASSRPRPTGAARTDALPDHLVAERARVVNRLQKVLEDTNIKLASVVTNILGKSVARHARCARGRRDRSSRSGEPRPRAPAGQTASVAGSARRRASNHIIASC